MPLHTPRAGTKQHLNSTRPDSTPSSPPSSPHLVNLHMSALQRFLTQQHIWPEIVSYLADAPFRTVPLAASSFTSDAIAWRELKLRPWRKNDEREFVASLRLVSKMMVGLRSVLSTLSSRKLILSPIFFRRLTWTRDSGPPSSSTPSKTSNSLSNDSRIKKRLLVHSFKSSSLLSKSTSLLTSLKHSSNSSPNSLTSEPSISEELGSRQISGQPSLLSELSTPPPFKS